ncbi:MAG TPA: hypothetical protein VHQ97_09750 [Solirubrobacterales bacterium]|nr:hypothetical protein [Solirubrobacterales bacterium]
MSPGRALIGAVLVAVLVVPLLLAGCGGDSETERLKEEIQVENAVREAHLKALLKVKLAERKRREEHPGETLAPPRYTGVLAERYEVDRELCSALPPNELAANLEIDEGSSPEEIARAYAKTYTKRFREPAYEGCLAGME